MTERPTDITGSSVLDESVPFARRHIGPAPEDQAKMLAVLGYSSLEDLVDTAVPVLGAQRHARSRWTPAAPSTRCSTSCVSSPAATRC